MAPTSYIITNNRVPKEKPADVIDCNTVLIIKMAMFLVS
jgi:hypothetical protein